MVTVLQLRSCDIAELTFGHCCPPLAVLMPTLCSVQCACLRPWQSWCPPLKLLDSLAALPCIIIHHAHLCHPSSFSRLLVPPYSVLHAATYGDTATTHIVVMSKLSSLFASNALVLVYTLLTYHCVRLFISLSVPTFSEIYLSLELFNYFLYFMNFQLTIAICWF